MTNIARPVKMQKTENSVMLETQGSGRVCVTYCRPDGVSSAPHAIQLAVLGGETTLRVVEAKALIEVLVDVVNRPAFGRASRRLMKVTQ